MCNWVKLATISIAMGSLGSFANAVFISYTKLNNDKYKNGAFEESDK